VRRSTLDPAPGIARRTERKERPMNTVTVVPTADILLTEATRF
jgi:hypothetical protein